MFNRRVLMAVAALVATAGFTLSSVASASAGVRDPTTPTVVANYPSTSDRCVNARHTKECWAKTKDKTPLYLRQGGKKTLGGNDLVLITCWYATLGGTVWDHVIAENAGGWGYIGHIWDGHIDLNEHNPWQLQYPPNIPLC